MNIIYLHQYFKTPSMSGGTRSYEMARRMVAAGHEVHIITTCSDGSLKGNDWVIEEIEGINVHWLPVPYDNSMSYGRRLLAFTAFARRVGSYAKRIGGDIVLASSTPLTIAIPGVNVSRSLKVPLVFEVRDLWPEVPAAMGALNFPLFKWLAGKLESWAYKNSARVIGLSTGMCEGIIRTGYPARQTVCIPNSSDIELFAVSDEEGRRFRAERPWIGNRQLVVYAGTFGRVNGVSYMVELANAMQRINPEMRFLAVGSGAEVSKVEERARELGVLERNFFIEGPIPKSDMPALLNAASVCSSFVIPLEALWNNSANKFFDSLAASRPIVINHGGWQADLLDESGAGLSLSHIDLTTAANQLNDFLSDDALLEEARGASYELAKSRFSRDKLASQLINLLEDVQEGADVKANV